MVMMVMVAHMDVDGCRIGIRQTAEAEDGG
jgi:hypothetical protein